MPQPRAAPGKSDRAVELSVLLGGASKSLWWCSSGHGNPSGIEGPPGYGNRRRLKFHQYSTSGLQKLSLLSLPKTPPEELTLRRVWIRRNSMIPQKETLLPAPA